MPALTERTPCSVFRHRYGPLCPLNGRHRHLDVTWTLFLSVPPPQRPCPLGWFPALAPLTPPSFVLRHETMPPEAQRLFLHLRALLSSLLPYFVKCTWQWQGWSIDDKKIKKNYFRNFGISVCPTGQLHKKTPKALLLPCGIMVAAHSVTALRQQLLSDLTLPDVLLIITNRPRSSMLLALECGSWHSINGKSKNTVIMTIIPTVFDLADGKNPPQKWSMTVRFNQNELVFITTVGAVLEGLSHYVEFKSVS